MDYLSVAHFAKEWSVSDRTVRNYCTSGKISGAVLVGKTWKIPADTEKPTKGDHRLLKRLKNEHSSRLKGGIYHKLQIEFTYNSNHIEGSKLTHDQTRYIYETNTIGIENDAINVDDILETVNHFRCIDYVIENANKPLSENFIKHLHFLLKSSTSDSNKNWFNVGDYKNFPNEVGGNQTTDPENVSFEIQKLLLNYKEKQNITFDDIVEFHWQFECIHPFQDGNGRVGRLIALKECLKNNITPFVIDEHHKMYYYRGLSEYKTEKGFLLDTCASAQENFNEWLKYFRI
ncbi:MAG: Fic family protein [Clostridia bacterium]